METLDPTPYHNEGPDVVNIPKKGGGFLEFLKHSFLLVLLIGVIVSSFWVSFNLGKRLLVPVRKLPQRNIEIALPEPPAVIAALEEFEEVTVVAEEDLSPLVKVVETPKAAQPKPEPKPTVSRTVAPSGAKYYKVQAGVFSDKANAFSQAQKLKASGFETFIRKVSQGWRVQAGAYFSKQWALNLQSSLKAKGFESVLIYE
ncbi:SPOR domain-containing protein [Candidatus Margulisiibacteriota bacterium]